jgi:hypothetical protein
VAGELQLDHFPFHRELHSQSQWGVLEDLAVLQLLREQLQQMGVAHPPVGHLQVVKLTHQGKVP